MMRRHSRSLYAVALAALLGAGVALPAAAHGDGPGQPYHHGWHQGWHGDPGMMPGMMMQGCPMMSGPGMMGPGMMGPGMMHQGMMHQGMMHPGMMSPYGRPSMVGPRHWGPGYGPDGDSSPMMGPGMDGRGMNQGMGPSQRGMMAPPASDPVSIEDVTRLLQRRLDWQGNPHVKLGKVEEKDADTIVAEIVTQEGSLVERLEVDRRSGWMRMVP